MKSKLKKRSSNSDQLQLSFDFTPRDCESKEDSANTDKIVPIESARKRLIRKNEEQYYDEILQRFLDHEEQLDW